MGAQRGGVTGLLGLHRLWCGVTAEPAHPVHSGQGGCVAVEAVRVLHQGTGWVQQDVWDPFVGDEPVVLCHPPGGLQRFDRGGGAGLTGDPAPHFAAGCDQSPPGPEQPPQPHGPAEDDPGHHHYGRGGGADADRTMRRLPGTSECRTGAGPPARPVPYRGHPGPGLRANLVDVQEMVGHANPRTTRRCDWVRGRLDRDPSYVVAPMLNGT